MNCRRCGALADQVDRYCRSCGEPIEAGGVLFAYSDEREKKVDPKADEANRKSLNIGILTISLNCVAFFYFGFLGFVGLGLSIYGYQLARQEANRGYPHSGALTTNIVGIVLSSLTSIIMLIYYLT